MAMMIMKLRVVETRKCHRKENIEEYKIPPKTGSG